MDEEEAPQEDLSRLGQNWEGLLRGTLMGAVIQKFMHYVHLADQKAQAIIILNTVIIPVALTGLNNAEFKVGATFSIIACIISIYGAMMSIYPKRREGHKPDGSFNFFHFGDVGRMTESKFMKEFMPIYQDPRLLSVEAAKSLHDMSKNIIIPKFFWLKVSYGSFFIGNVIAIIWVMIKFWFLSDVE